MASGRGLRIVGGTLRGRRLHVPATASFRPTGDRVRESLFNLLGGAFDVDVVVDAYAGSGALGLEALSRGARRAIFVERSREAAERILRVAEAWGLSGRVEVRARDVRRELANWSGPPVGLLLADPPYDGDEAGALVRRLDEDPGPLVPGGLVVVERPTKSPLPAPVGHLTVRRQATYGIATLELFDVVGDAGER